MIEVRKMLGNKIKDATVNSRHDRCLLCGKKGGFCNSHTIPQFCLENIAWNGKLNSFNTLIDSNLLKRDSGINNAATFHIICKSCDSKVFQDYENEDAYLYNLSESAINQIVLKTSLRDIYKHEMEVKLFENIKRTAMEKCPFFSHLINSQINARERDIEECYEIFNKAKSFLSSQKSQIRIVSYDRLDYITPIAFRGMVAMVTGVNGEIINNYFNHAKKYKMEYLHIAVFPLKEATAVVVLIDPESTRYEQFEKFLSGTTLDRRLEIINRIIMLYTEDYFLSKQLSEETIKSLADVAKTLPDIFTFNARISVKNAVKDYDLRRDICIPNLLSRDYAVTL